MNPTNMATSEFRSLKVDLNSEVLYIHNHYNSRTTDRLHKQADSTAANCKVMLLWCCRIPGIKVLI